MKRTISKFWGRVGGRSPSFTWASVLLTSILLLACSDSDVSDDPVKTGQSPVIYVPPGESNAPNQLLKPEIALDKRREVWDEQRPVSGEGPQLPNWQWLRSYAQQATVVLMHRDQIDCIACRDVADPDLLDFGGSSLLKDGGMIPLCPGQRFGDQPRASFCSGTLIDDDLILTAGHCLRETGQDLAEYHSILIDAADECALTPSNQPDVAKRTNGKIENLRVVFNYFSAGEGQLPKVRRSRDVFRVAEVVWTDRLAGDISILRLLDESGNPTRATPRFQPVPLRRQSRTLFSGTPLAKIGGPSGIPLKIAESRSFGWVSGDHYLFKHKLDVLGADSGGGIYDLNDGTLYSWVHTGIGLQVEGTCTSADNKLCFDRCTGQMARNPDGTPRQVLQILDYFPTKQNCQRAYYHRMHDTDTVEARQYFETHGMTNVSVGPPSTGELGTAHTVELLRHVYCGAPLRTPLGPESMAVLSKIEVAVQKKDTQNIVRNSRICAEDMTTSDEFLSLKEIQLQHGREISLEGQTSGGQNLVSLGNFPGGESCNDVGGTPDAMYRISVDTPTLLYADTFNFSAAEIGDLGTNFDTTLFLFKVDLPGSSLEQREFLTCQEDSLCFDGGGVTPWGVQSQLMYWLEPGHYILGVTGFRGQTGRFKLHVQSLPASRRGEIVVAPQGSGPLLVNDFAADTRGTVDVPESDGQSSPRCEDILVGGAPDYQYVMASCPDFTGGAFGGTTIDLRTQFDTVLGLRQGNQPANDGYQCNDDHGIDVLNQFIPEIKLHSLLGQVGGLGIRPATLSSGSGLRSFYVDGYFEFNKGEFRLHTEFPTAGATRSGTFGNIDDEID